MKNSILLSMAVLGLLSLSSCGKSNDVKKVGDVTAQTELGPAPEQNGAPVPTNGAATETAADINGGLQPAPTGRPGSISNDTNNPEAGSGGSVAAPRVVTAGDVTLAANIQFDGIESAKTGGKLNTLNYTSAGSDGLMAEFKLKAKTVSAEQQKMNQNLAAAIVSAKISRVSNAAAEMSLNLVLNEFGNLKTYKIKAVADGDKMKLISVSAAGDLEFQGGFLKCLDQNTSCDTSYVKIKMSGAYARIIFRTSSADMHFGIYTNDQAARNLNFDLWKTYISNKTNATATVEKIDMIQLSSFEVLNGAASLGLLMTTLDRDVVGLSVPLLAAEKGVPFSASVSKSENISNNYDLVSPVAAPTLKLSRALLGAKLIANNGLGQLRMVLSFSTDVKDSKIFMTLSRIQKPVMSILDVQKFEATIPKF